MYKCLSILTYMHPYMCMNTTSTFYSLLITLYYAYVCTCYRDGLALRIFIKKSRPSFLLILFMNMCVILVVN